MKGTRTRRLRRGMASWRSPAERPLSPRRAHLSVYMHKVCAVLRLASSQLAPMRTSIPFRAKGKHPSQRRPGQVSAVTDQSKMKRAFVQRREAGGRRLCFPRISLAISCSPCSRSYSSSHWPSGRTPSPPSSTLPMCASDPLLAYECYAHPRQSAPKCPGPNADPGTVGIVGDATPKTGALGACVQVNQLTKSLSVWNFTGGAHARMSPRLLN
jgi:hypothetical protein